MDIIGDAFAAPGTFRTAAGRFRSRQAGLRHFPLAGAAGPGDNALHISNKEMP